MTTEISRLPNPAEWAGRIRSLATDLLSISADYVVALNDKPELRSQLIDLNIPAGVLDRLEATGRGQLNPQLFYDINAAATRLITCPRSVQDKVIADGVEIWINGDVRNIPLNDLTPAQVRQAFTRGKLRSPTEQRSWLESQAPAATNGDDWIVKADTVTHRKAGLRISKRQILTWLAEMK